MNGAVLFFLLYSALAGYLLTTVITQRKRIKQLEEERGRDDLTGLLNRGVFNRVFPRMVQGLPGKSLHLVDARNHNLYNVLTTLFIDLDRFKQINDTHGHPVGDEVLRTVSAAMVGLLRENDLVFRYGGEEFVVVLPDVPPERAQAVAEKLREKIGKLEFPSVPGMRVSASIGMDTVTQQDIPEEVLKRADLAVYRAKAEGRDRVVVSQG